MCNVYFYIVCPWHIKDDNFNPSISKNICIIASMQNKQLERKNYFYSVNMTYFVNSKHFPNMIGQKWHTPLSMRIWIQMTTSVFVFFSVHFSNISTLEYRLEELRFTGAITHHMLQTCIMTEVKILSWRKINCMLIL